MLVFNQVSIARATKDIQELEDELNITTVNFLSNNKKTELVSTLSGEYTIKEFENLKKREIIFNIVVINKNLNQIITNLKKTIETLEKAEKLLTITKQAIKLIDKENQQVLTKKIEMIKDIEINWNDDVYDQEIPYRQALDREILTLEVELWQIETRYGIICNDCYDPDFIVQLQSISS